MHPFHIKVRVHRENAAESLSGRFLHYKQKDSIMNDIEETKGIFEGVSTQSNVVFYNPFGFYSYVPLGDIRDFLMNFIQQIEDLSKDPMGYRVEDVARVLKVRVEDVKGILEVLGDVLENGSYLDERKLQSIKARLAVWEEGNNEQSADF
jgi:hypothetical protein